MKVQKNFFLILMILFAAEMVFAQIQIRKSLLSETGAQDSFPGLPFDSVHTATVALNTKTGNSLVAWQRLVPTGRMFVGRVLDAKGNTITGVITILGPDINNFKSLQSLAYNPITNEFLLVYGYRKNIWVVRLKPNGRPVEKSINITNEPLTSHIDGRGDGKALFNPRTGGYTVLWSLHGVLSILDDSFLEGVELTDNGVPSGPLVTFLLQKVRRFSALDYAYLPSGNKILAVHREKVNTNNFEFWLQRLDPLLMHINPSPAGLIKINRESLGQVLTRDTRVACLGFFSDLSGVVFYADDTTIRGRKIDSQGNLSGDPFVAFQSPAGNKKLGLPSVAFATTPKGVRGILIGNEDMAGGGMTTWAQVLNEKGEPIGTPVVVNTTLTSERINNGAISALPVDPANKVARFIWCATLADADLSSNIYQG